MKLHRLSTRAKFTPRNRLPSCNPSCELESKSTCEITWQRSSREKRRRQRTKWGNLFSYPLSTFQKNMEQLFAIFLDICDREWSYFDGFCYFTSQKCTNWTTALSKCQEENSVLVDVNNNEENVFIQNRHNGEKSWLGFNDRSTESDFIWAGRGPGNFTAWAKNQPNNFREEDCVHALGVEYSYEWNDVKCNDCHQYTCKKGRLCSCHRLP